MVKRKKYIIGLIIMFIIGCLLASGIYAYASSVKFKMSIQLSPTIYFTMHLNKFTDTNDNNILDNTESKTLISDVCIFSNVDSVTANSSYARVNGLTITLILNDDLKLQNETEKYILTVTNYNTGKYMLFEMLTSDNNAFETTPTTLKNIAVPNGQNYYNKSMVIESKALQEVNYIFNVYAEIYDTAIVEHTVNNGSYNVAYVGEDYEVDLTPSNSNMCVVVDSVKLGETTLNVNTDYNFDQVTNVLTIYKESLNANNNNNITITTTEKPKFISTMLTLDGCSARFDNKIYHDKTNNSISNIQSTQNMAFLFTPSDADYLKWTFTVKLNGSEIDYTWDYSSKVLSIDASEIVGDLAITAKAEIKYWSGVPGTQFAGGSGTETDPFLIEDGEQLAYLAEITNTQATTAVSAGKSYTILAGCENSYFEMTNNIYLNDETFEFQDDTGLVKVTDGKNTCYLGTGAPGDDSGTNTKFDETASSRGIFYDSSFNELTVTATDTTTTYLNGGIIHTWSSIGSVSYLLDGEYAAQWSDGFSGSFDGMNNFVTGAYGNSLLEYDSRFSIFGFLQDGNITNLINKCAYFHGWRYQAGISSYSMGGIIENCINYATVISGQNGAGGIAGDLYDYDSAIVQSCINYGTVISHQNSGGILGLNGYPNRVGVVDNCVNYGKVYGVNTIGGVCGLMEIEGSLISNCQNYGAVTATGNNCGGIAGSSNSGMVSNCTNYASVTSTGYYRGGVVGRNESGNVSNCVNNGNILGTQSSVGGVVGYNKAGTVEDCVNNGNIELAGGHCGGVVGYNVEGGELIGSINYGDVYYSSLIDSANVGGCVGYYLDNSTMSACANYGNIYVFEALEYIHCGGVVGRAHASIEQCYNAGNIYATSLIPIRNGVVYFGGVMGCITGETSVMQDCYNIGNILAVEDCYIGGVVGLLGNYGTPYAVMKNCYNLGHISPITGDGKGMVIAYLGEHSKGYYSYSLSFNSDDKVTGCYSDRGIGLEEGLYFLNSSTKKPDNEVDSVTGVFETWDFDTVWGYVDGENDGYPILQCFYPEQFPKDNAS